MTARSLLAVLLLAVACTAGTGATPTASEAPEATPSSPEYIEIAAHRIARVMNTAIRKSQIYRLTFRDLRDLDGYRSDTGRQFASLLAQRLFELASDDTQRASAAYEVSLPPEEGPMPVSGLYVDGTVTDMGKGRHRVILRLVRAPDHVIIASGRATVIPDDDDEAMAVDTQDL